MAASASSINIIPQTVSLSRHSSAAYTFPLFTPSSIKPLPKLTVSIFSKNGNRIITTNFERSSKFTRKVAMSSEVDELDNDGFDFSSPREPSFSPDLKVFVGNLPYTADSSVLAGLFQQAGNVEMVEVIYDKATGRSRGFGFVTMSTAEEAELAAQQFNGYELEGRPLKVNSGPAPPKRESSFSSRGPKRGGSRQSYDSGNKVFVGNLSWGVDNLALETLFSEQGNVVEARVIYDRDTGRSRGFGFVTYSSADEVNNACESLDGVDLDGRQIRVTPAESRSRPEF